MLYEVIASVILEQRTSAIVTVEANSEDDAKMLVANYEGDVEVDMSDSEIISFEIDNAREFEVNKA